MLTRKFHHQIVLQATGVGAKFWTNVKITSYPFNIAFKKAALALEIIDLALSVCRKSLIILGSM